MRPCMHVVSVTAARERYGTVGAYALPGLCSASTPFCCAKSRLGGDHAPPRLRRTPGISAAAFSQQLRLFMAAFLTVGLRGCRAVPEGGGGLAPRALGVAEALWATATTRENLFGMAFISACPSSARFELPPPYPSVGVSGSGSTLPSDE